MPDSTPSPVKLVILTGSDSVHESVVHELQGRGFTSKAVTEICAVRSGLASPHHGNGELVVDGATGARLMMRDMSRNNVVIVTAADGSRTTECRYTGVKPESFPTLSEMEREHILTALRQSDWNCMNAAKLLGIDRSTLYRKIKRYALKQP